MYHPIKSLTGIQWYTVNLTTLGRKVPHRFTEAKKSMACTAILLKPYCNNSEIKRDISRKSWFFQPHPPFIRYIPPLGGSRWNVAFPFRIGKLEWWIYPTVKKVWGYDCVLVLTECTNVTDTHTDTDTAWRQRPRLMLASRGKNRYAFALVHVIIQNMRAWVGFSVSISWRVCVKWKSIQMLVRSQQMPVL